MSRVMKKHVFICADQLRGNSAFDRTIPLLSVSKIPSLYLSSVAEQLDFVGSGRKHRRQVLS